MCEDGTEYNFTSSTCDMCSVGFYRQSFVQDLCTICPEEFITQDEGSVTSADCIVGKVKRFSVLSM